MNIENKRQVVTILLAVGLGLIASMLMSKVVNDKVDQQTQIIAKEYQGRSAALIKEIDASKQMLNKLAQDHAALAKKVAERPVITQATGTPTQQPVQQTIFSLRTPPGKRAITMEINSLAAVGGLVYPGDFVDILAQLDMPKDLEAAVIPGKGNTDKVISVIFQNVQVLAVGTTYDPVNTPPAYPTQQAAKTLHVTFAVNPEEASLLAFAQDNGNLQLSLRSPAETQDRLLQQVASWDALSEFVLERQGTEMQVPKRTVVEEEEELKAVEEEKPFIQIFRGGREL